MLLALDTSTRTAGLALYDGVHVLSEVTWTSGEHHTVEVAPAVEAILERAGLEMKDLKAVAVATGPGSFTGLRIGLAIAKGLALSLRLPVIGVPTLDALAVAQPVRDLSLAAVLQAGRGRLAVAWYHVENEAWQSYGKVEVLDIHALTRRIHTPTLVCGELSEEERNILARKYRNVSLASPAQSLRRAAFLAELAWKRWQAGQIDDPVTLAPIYLHIGEPIPA
jgi:tRNA threonylcarbamoyladenosine biosynthesis protein TsaB